MKQAQITKVSDRAYVIGEVGKLPGGMGAVNSRVMAARFALLLSFATASATSDHFMTMSMGCGAITGCASSRAFVDAFSKMHQAMALNFTCDANVDFVHGMIAHHEGEVAMCDALLNSDSVVDTELRALCVDLTRQQNDEVQLLEAWLLTQGHPSHASGHNHWCDHQPPPSSPGGAASRALAARCLARRTPP